MAMFDTPFLILSMLASHSSGLFGAELLERGEGKLKRSSLYNHLERMEDSKWIRTEEVAQEGDDDPRIRHIITARGRMVLQEHGAKTGLVFGLRVEGV
jgi:DNA-binding PadR family transcriptional regulator